MAVGQSVDIMIWSEHHTSFSEVMFPEFVRFIYLVKVWCSITVDDELKNKDTGKIIQPAFSGDTAYDYDLNSGFYSQG